MKGFLMINLGSPDSTSIKDVKKYLDEFLMDERVIGKSYWFRWFLVKVIILNTRPRKSAKAYKKIWWKVCWNCLLNRQVEKNKNVQKNYISSKIRYSCL